MQIAFSSLLNRLPKPAFLETRTGRILLGLAILALLLLGFTYHAILALVGVPAAPATDALYNVAVLIAYGLIFGLLFRHYDRVKLGPVRVFWGSLLTGFIVILGGAVLYSIEGNGGGFHPETGLPLTLATVVKMNVLIFLEAIFAFTLLLRLRELALFKRSKASLRNWYVMFGLMVVTGLTMFGAEADSGLNTISTILVVIAVVLMVMNSFRLAWIVFLSIREKFAVIGLSLLLLVLLSLSLSQGSTGLAFGAAGEPFGRFYSYPLNLFITLSIVFGILYCVTSLLSLMFHLPTSGTIQKKTGEMAAMHSLSRLVGQAIQPDRLASTIVASPVEAGTAQTAWLALPDLKSGTLKARIVATNNIEAEVIAESVDVQALAGEVASRGQAILVNQTAADHRIKSRPGETFGSLLVVPLMARDEYLGALFVTKEVAHGFEADDVETMTGFANQAALALENARLFEEQLEKERLARELAIAREVQMRLLPQRVPVIDGLNVAASSVSAREVGGDYYDFMKMGDDRLGVIVADVSGKGTSAAFYMAELKGIFQSLSRLSLSPAASLTHANDALAGSLERNAFISAVYGVLDFEKGEFVFARAGHCPIALISRKGDARFLRSRGLGLGLSRSDLFESVLEEHRIKLKPGDTLILYTDGFVEGRGSDGEEYGYQRLLEVSSRNRQMSAMELHEALLSDLSEFIQQDHYEDDLTLVVIKWEGIEGTGAARNEHSKKSSEESWPYEKSQLTQESR